MDPADMPYSGRFGDPEGHIAMNQAVATPEVQPPFHKASALR